VSEATPTPEAQASGDASHAPQAQPLLFPLAVAAILLGALFLVFYLLLGLSLGVQGADLEAAAIEERRVVMLGAGVLLTLMGVALMIVKATSSDAAGAGKARAAKALNVGLMIAQAGVILVLVNYIFARHELWRGDMTSSGQHSISEESLVLARGLERDVKVAVLMSPSGDDAQDLIRVVEQYAAASARIRIEQHDPLMMDRRDLQLLLSDLDLDPDLREQDLMGLVVQLGGQGPDGAWQRERSIHLPMNKLWTRDPSNPAGQRVFMAERLVSSALRELLEAKSAKIYLLQGHGEVDLHDLDPRVGIARAVELLRQRDLVVEPLNLLRREGVDVPEDCDLLLVIGPQSALTADELRGVRDYLDGGGNGIFLAEPYFRPGPSGTSFERTGLGSLLMDRYGVEPLDEVVFLMFQKSSNELAAVADLYSEDLDAVHQITKLLPEQARIYFHGSRPLQVRPKVRVVADKLVTTDGWKDRCFSSSDPASRTQTPQSRRPGPFTLAVAAEYTPDPETPDGARKASRVVIVGDKEWLTDQVFVRNAYQNPALFLNMVLWTLDREERIAGDAYQEPNHRLAITPGALSRLQGLACPGMPFVALALGLFAWVVRARS
jgi:hypothetical protein